jgi:HK97 family phage major capsid protein
MVVKTSTTNVRGITPDQTSDLIVLPVERASVAIQASTVIATEATRTHIPLVTEDPSAAWVAEGDEIGASDPKLDDVIVEPAKIAGLTVVTNELARDSSPAAQNIIGDGLSRDIARKIDLAYFGSRGTNLVQPKGLGDLTGFTAVTAGTTWTNLDPFAEAIANADGLGLTVDSFVANPADALALAKLKETTTGSNKPLLGSDPTAATRRLLQGVPLLTSPGVAPGTVWGIPKVRAIVVRRLDVELDIDSSAYFTSDRTAIRAVMRVSFAFPHAAAIQKIKLAAA